MPAAIDTNRIEAALRDDIGSWRGLVYADETGSTNDDVRTAQPAHLGLQGSWVMALADAQKNGRGRLGHGWFSPAGGAIHLSLAAELALSTPLWPRASLVVGGAAARAISDVTGIDVRLKWPNDLLVSVDGTWRKAGGILCERHEPARGPALWICGIGVDVAIERSAFPTALQDHVASLSWLAPAADRTELALALALAIRRDIEAWQARGGQLAVEELRKRAVFIGDIVTIDEGDGGAARDMRLVDLANDGGLIVQPPGGGPTENVAPLQILAAQSNPPWHAPPRLPR